MFSNNTKIKLLVCQKKKKKSGKNKAASDAERDEKIKR